MASPGNWADRLKIDGKGTKLPKPISFEQQNNERLKTGTGLISGLVGVFALLNGLVDHATHKIAELEKNIKSTNGELSYFDNEEIEEDEEKNRPIYANIKKLEATLKQYNKLLECVKNCFSSLKERVTLLGHDIIKFRKDTAQFCRSLPSEVNSFEDLGSFLSQFEVGFSQVREKISEKEIGILENARIYMKTYCVEYIQDSELLMEIINKLELKCQNLFL